MTGGEALELARAFKPTAISLDVFLPDMLGWTVLSRLKQDPQLRHIPVQMLTLDEDRQHGLARGAFDFISKPIAADELTGAIGRVLDFSKPRRRRLLVVEDDPAEQMSIRELIAHDDVEIAAAETGAEALRTLREGDWDCVVLDLKLPDMSGFDVLERMREQGTAKDVPVVVFTGKELSAEEDARLHTMARSIVVKGVESPERLLGRNRALPAPGCRRSAGGKAAHAGAPAWLGRRPAWRALCCWSTTTRATSSRSQACWSGAACAC